jgi:adenylylsulfate kinase
VKKVLVMGLPGAGKTTLAKDLARELKAVHWNADEVRMQINRDLKFSLRDRVEQARRMGVLCDVVNRAGVWAVADFVCPTQACRDAFGQEDYHLIWCDRVKASKFADTDAIFEPPEECLFRIDGDMSSSWWARKIASLIL